MIKNIKFNYDGKCMTKKCKLCKNERICFVDDHKTSKVKVNKHKIV